ncbi:MAG: DUF4037 domain-containing protein, partial [Candidatus Competibacteraceae bacterium]|nr:DUF4037 domain-containing protein [Candidatus Competibacteraceae bacterium]
VDNRFWEPGDEWLEQGEQLQVDVMFRSTDWIAEGLEEVLIHHRAALGYSTCLWHNVLTSRVLFDRSGWFGQLQAWAAQPYPEPLRRAVVAKNHPILARSLSAYSHQLEKAVARHDLVSLNHRVAAFLASYFDLLFALNRRPHPGEKRLLTLVERFCPLRPVGLEERVEELLRAAGTGEARVVDLAEQLTAALEPLLEGEGLLRG